jgi:hypothetical protein
MVVLVGSSVAEGEWTPTTVFPFREYRALG